MTSTKLNAEELAANRYKDEHEPDAVINVSPYQWVRLGYSCAIKEVAQPLADERDELRDALEAIEQRLSGSSFGLRSDILKTLSILAKYPKP